MKSSLQGWIFALLCVAVLHPLPVSPIRCYANSYDVKNWMRCSDYLYGEEQWDDKCMNAEPLPLCTDFRISAGCNFQTGILPCQFNWKGAFGEPRPGARLILPDMQESNLPYSYLLTGDGVSCSHGHDGQAGELWEYNVCLASVDRCHRKVTEVWEKGTLKYWTVVKGCGNCPWVCVCVCE
jgi:hypothetical protein